MTGLLMLMSLDARVLTALPMSSASSSWLTPTDVGTRVALSPDTARSVLERLRRRGLAEDDGARPQAFARTAYGDHALEIGGWL